ncbi:PsbP domain-containing protein, partial [Haematococcus lacustris]
MKMVSTSISAQPASLEAMAYAFKVPGGWGEVPVSIADLGGTEIDLRYSSREQGEVTVVVAPVMRFADI